MDKMLKLLEINHWAVLKQINKNRNGNLS